MQISESKEKRHTVQKWMKLIRIELKKRERERVREGQPVEMKIWWIGRVS